MNDLTHISLFTGRKALRSKIKYCINCGKQFEAVRASHNTCSRPCRSRVYNNSIGLGLPRTRFCRICGTPFTMTGIGKGQNNQWYCSDPCRKEAARQARCKFYKKNPHKLNEYHQRAREKSGPDGNLKRFYRRFPNAPRACESCGEARVLDVAHKPGHQRAGAWRSVANVAWPDKVWVLCPTCHALLDRMNYAPSDLGLEKEGGAICQTTN